MVIIKVAVRSRPTAVAGVIAGIVRESGSAKVRAIGARAVYQAVRAAAIARGYLKLDGFDVICILAFVEVESDDNTPSDQVYDNNKAGAVDWCDFCNRDLDSVPEGVTFTTCAVCRDGQRCDVHDLRGLRRGRLLRLRGGWALP
jgi:stage V sporulation protein SpoVS